MRNFNLLKSRTVAVVTGAVVVVGLGTTGATAAGLINSDDIRNNSIAGKDISRNAVGSTELGRSAVKSHHLANGAIGINDLRPFVQNQVNDKAEVNGLKQRVEALEAQVAALMEAEENNGTANTNWAANNGSTIVDANTVTLTKSATDSSDATSVEIANLDIPVQAGDKVTFDYALSDGALCTAGAPRVFVETQSVFTDSWTENIGALTQCGVDNGDGTFTVSFNVPANGRIGQAGVVYDDGSAGTITVTNLTVAGNAVSFQ
ncbi:MAG TPA: hypothetical protein VHG70_01910 [Nocardioidaceae bacterium]|nr:hypothetical protein [Nocardioidaceae bacterium]